MHKKRSDCILIFLAASPEELITMDPPGRPMRALVQKRNIFRITVSKEVAGGLDIQILCYEERSICVRALTGKEEDAGLAQEEPPGRCWRRRSGLATHLIQPFGLFCVWRLSFTGQCKASQQNWGPDPKDEGGDGVP